MDGAGPGHLPKGSHGGLPGQGGRPSRDLSHQFANEAGDPTVPWRTGLICLVDTISGHSTAVARSDPADAAERLAWWLWRALEWLRAASRGELIKPGDPFELPVFGELSTTRPMLAFREGTDSLSLWNAAPRSGFVDLSPVGNGRQALAARAFRTLAAQEVLRPRWGTLIAEATESLKGAWIRFDALPVLPPWQAPQTWGDLIGLARAEGWDLIAELRTATAGLRDSRSHLVLIGFPIPERMGGPAAVQHWVALRLPTLKSPKAAKTPMRGFRTQNAGWYADRLSGPMADEAPLEWVPSENWHPEDLGNRGHYQGGLGQADVALLGAGALGSMLSPLLVRGGVQGLAIIDNGFLQAGNLVRHILTMDDLGEYKSKAVAEHLKRATPNASIRAITDTFPSEGEDLQVALGRAKVVIDATADDSVLVGLGTYAWAGPKIFVPMSLDYGAEHLLLYFAAGESFPSPTTRARSNLGSSSRRRTSTPCRGRASVAGTRSSRHGRTTSL